MRVIKSITSKDISSVRSLLSKKVEASDTLKFASNPSMPFNDLMSRVYINNPSIKYIGSFEKNEIHANSPKALYWSSVKIELVEYPDGSKITLVMKLFWLYFGFNYFVIGLGVLVFFQNFTQTTDLMEALPGLIILAFGTGLHLFHRFRIMNTKKYFLEGV